jgi:hypothetical protein
MIQLLTPPRISATILAELRGFCIAGGELGSMEISSRGLNKGETFCCTRKEVKSVFGESDIHVSFAFFHRNFEPDSRFYKGPKIIGKIVASLYVSNRSGRIGALACRGQSLNFYVLNEAEFTTELHDEFVHEILLKMYQGYLAHLDGNPGGISGTYFFRVELYNGKYILHEGIE